MSDAMFGELSLIAMKGCESFIEKVDSYLKEWSGVDHSFVVNVCAAPGSGAEKERESFMSRCGDTMCSSSAMCSITV